MAPKPLNIYREARLALPLCWGGPLVLIQDQIFKKGPSTHQKITENSNLRPLTWRGLHTPEESFLKKACIISVDILWSYPKPSETFVAPGWFPALHSLDHQVTSILAYCTLVYLSKSFFTVGTAASRSPCAACRHGFILVNLSRPRKDVVAGTPWTPGSQRTFFGFCTGWAVVILMSGCHLGELKKSRVYLAWPTRLNSC